MAKNIEKKSTNSEITSTFKCRTCIKRAPLEHKFRHAGDNSVHNICVTCVACHIGSKVEANIYRIYCPDFESKRTLDQQTLDVERKRTLVHRTLDPVECRSLISREIFEKWSDTLFRSSVSDLKGCYCPYQNCSELLLNDCDETTTKCECPGCKRLFCYKCRVPWHAGCWCSETHQLRDPKERRFMRLVEQIKWMRCPGCGQPVELVVGCNRVQCRCGVRFCYHCGRTQCAPIGCRRVTGPFGRLIWGTLELFLFAVVDICGPRYRTN